MVSPGRVRRRPLFVLRASWIDVPPDQRDVPLDSFWSAEPRAERQLGEISRNAAAGANASVDPACCSAGRRAIVGGVREGKLTGGKAGYADVLADIAMVVEEARRAAARSINTIMTATYWEIGWRIVEQEQAGAARAGYGEALLRRLSADLTERFGRGFSVDRLETARLFYLAYPPIARGSVSPTSLPENSATASRKWAGKRSATSSRKLATASPPSMKRPEFRLSWSHYVLLIRRVDAGLPRSFYETEALRGGWTVRQLERQIDSQFYERTALSRNKVGLLGQGAIAKREDAITSCSSWAATSPSSAGSDASASGVSGTASTSSSFTAGYAAL